MAAFRSAELPRWTTRSAPSASICARSPAGTCSLVNTTHRSPARAAYAAAAAPAFPEDAATTVPAPAATAAATPAAIARSLCEPVGLPPSYFSHNSPAPTEGWVPGSSLRSRMFGVFPSPRVTGGPVVGRVPGQPQGPPG